MEPYSNVGALSVLFGDFRPDELRWCGKYSQLNEDGWSKFFLCTLLLDQYIDEFVIDLPARNSLRIRGTTGYPFQC